MHAAAALGTFLALPLALSIATPQAHAGVRLVRGPSASFRTEGGLDLVGRNAALEVSQDERYLVVTVGPDGTGGGVDGPQLEGRGRAVDAGRPAAATLLLPRRVLAFPSEPGDVAHGSTMARFDLDGIERPVEVDWVIERTARGFRVAGDFDVRTRQYGDELERCLGVTAAEDLSVQTRFELAAD